ncbi:heme exporter protein CcmD [Pseudoalteromonas carrageenovora]|uniref:Heme exporter protein D n=1 Tax=Pseudoalteromonas carrageenovora IAM 12662 TaxID=1314868 RepID=A0A2K4X7J1_PSEVC|nr:heme exporter protein CcmD [Pseudoalteromonas carrageenovora]SOU40284.1 Heme exporter protein D [Pseudoalteromonas carrageenovora IAM 12662]
MQFDSFSDFIAMGGYGFYVWLSFGACALILLGILLNSLRDTKRIMASVEQQIIREERIKKAKQEQTS